MITWGFALRRSSQVLWPGWAAVHHRLGHTAAAKELHELQPKYFPFEVTADEAKQRFLKWQSKSWLSPSNILAADKYILTPVMLPYWIFTLKGKVQYTGTVGSLKPTSSRSNNTNNGISSDSNLLWKEVGWTHLDKYTEFNPGQPEMQIHASYQHRRDFTEAMKQGLPPLIQAQSLTKTEEATQEICVPKEVLNGNCVQLELPEMRKAIAWEFALRGSHEIATKLAYERLKQAHQAERIKNLNVVLSPIYRQATLIYVPAYSLSYVHGETHNVHGERQPQHFSGLISGLRTGGVAGERHISVQKAATLGGTLTLGMMGILSVLSPLIGADPFMWTSFDFIFSALSIGAASGLIAQMTPNFLLRDTQSNKIFYGKAGEAAAASFSSTPLRDGFERIIDLEETQRTNLEWLRWEESEKRGWNAEKRQRWAQQIWEAQHYRRRERRRVLQQAQKEQARRQTEEFRERKRRSRWGPRSTHYTHHEFLGGANGRADFKGYYKALALDPTIGHVSNEEIKRAFRKAAMQWHPDKHTGAAEKRKAREHFQLIRTAYETLKDPERRKNYDLGLPHGESTS